MSNQVMMMPTVMDLGGPPLGISKVAFVSFETVNDSNYDRHGVLRIADYNCNEIARFPDPNVPQPIPLSCQSHYANLNTLPQLSPISGLALGNIDSHADVEIIGVLDDHTTNNGGIIAFHLVAGVLVPLWCSAPLPTGDLIPSASAPAIGQLDKQGTKGALFSEIILDNKVFNFNGSLRFTGFNLGGGNCAGSGGVPCPRSQTAIVSNVLGLGSLPQVIMGRGIYEGGTGNNWTGSLGWITSSIPNPINPGYAVYVFPAVADLDPPSGPEIVVVDRMTSMLRVLDASGNQLTAIAIPNGGGGPPMIADTDGIPGPEICVASNSNYTVFKYHPGIIPTLAILWSKPTLDISGAASSTLYGNPKERRIYYNDQRYLWVFNAANGAVLQNVPNSSLTYFEGPIVNHFESSAVPGTVIVSANDIGCSLLLGCIAGGQHGLRIFNDPAIVGARSYWNQHTYHLTNVTSNVGTIPAVESPSWKTPAPNTYRVQQ
jgi:hypothetical protein